MIERDASYEMVHGDAFIDEMEKISGIGSALKGLTQAGRGRLIGAGVGAGVGAVGGAATSSPDDRVGGAIRGALLGGVAGTGAGQLATRQGRAQSKVFGQRQLHGMTGYVPRTQAQKARGVGFSGKGLSTDERINALKQMKVDVGSKVTDKAKAVQEAMQSQGLTRGLPENMRKRLASLEVAGIQARRDAAEKGLTSIPGALKGIAKDPLGTLKAGTLAQGPAGIALGVVPAAAMLPGAVSGKGYGEEYSGAGGMGRMIGENLGYAALGATPIAPMMIGGALAGKAGEFLGKKGKQGVEQIQAGRIAK